MNENNIPVYLFTGFLESGKTTFIQQTLCDPTFDLGGRTLLLLCEEGIEEYEPAAWSTGNVFVEVLEEESGLTAEHLADLLGAHGCTNVIVEYNGMWQLDSLYSAMPAGWVVYQEFMFADSNTFLSYNQNMRSLMVDKLRSCEILVLNRDTGRLDRDEVFRIVRAINRRCDIAYENLEGKAVYDERPVPLPFDLDARIVEIGPDAYAAWYADMGEQLDRYHGKTVRFVGRVLTRENSPVSFLIGRDVMTCCEADIQFAPLAAVWQHTDTLVQNSWYEATAVIEVREHPAYDGPGPVLRILTMHPAQAPEPEVATYF